MAILTDQETSRDELDRTFDCLREQVCPPAEVYVGAAHSDPMGCASELRLRPFPGTIAELTDEVEADVLCFLPAGCRLPPEYFAYGLDGFDRWNIGLVCPAQEPGCGAALSTEPVRVDLSVPAPSLVRTEALHIARSGPELRLDQGWLPDRAFWNQVLDHGWDIRRQRCTHFPAHREPSQSAAYSDSECLSQETLTLMVPLAGRDSCWRVLSTYLGRQSWPREQIQLLLFDTSQSDSFSAAVRGWLSDCKYPNYRYIRSSVGTPGLADLPRAAVVKQVAFSMARIYGRLSKEATTRFVWILEDDVIPPVDAAERLMRGFDAETASVSAAYRSRTSPGYVAWQADQSLCAARRRGVHVVGGNGFGCVIIRGDVLRNTVFTATLDFGTYDNAFYDRLARTGMLAKLDWSVECEHLASEGHGEGAR